LRKLLVAIALVLIPVSAFTIGGKFFEHHYSYKLTDVLKADKFVKKDGYWEGYRNGKLIGYVLISDRWTPKLVGYSGKHMKTLIGISPDGTITGVKLLFHSEPIVLIGLNERNYLKFLEQYPGKKFTEDLTIGSQISMDAITGATVTAMVQNAIIVESARAVAEKVGILAKKHVKARGRISKKFFRQNWAQLLASGGIHKIVITKKDLGIGGNEPYLEIYYGLATPAAIGQNVLGESMYSKIMDKVRKKGTALLLFAKGEGSIKGAGFARGGMFDRFQVIQGDKTFIFKDINHIPITKLKAKGAPQMKEGGIFMLFDSSFKETAPFKLRIILPYRVGGVKKFKTFTDTYVLPERYIQA